MRTSRLLAQRLALLETLLRDAKTEADRKRIVRAIRQVRGIQGRAAGGTCERAYPKVGGG